MKILLLFFVLLLSIGFSYGQFTLEHSFDNGSPAYVGSTAWDQTFIVDFEVMGDEYVIIDRNKGDIEIYDSIFNLVKTMTPPDSLLKASIVNNSSILYLSQHLFNTDDKIEYMLCPSVAGPNIGTYIFDEDGNRLFYKPHQVPAIIPNYEQQQLPIYNTTFGTKMILSSSTSDSSYIYSIAGHLSTAIQSPIGANYFNSQTNRIFPNPSSILSTIDYNLEQEDLPATLTIVNFDGLKIGTELITSQKGSISVSTLNLPAGLYYYSITTSKDVIPGKKFAVIH